MGFSGEEVTCSVFSGISVVGFSFTGVVSELISPGTSSIGMISPSTYTIFIRQTKIT